MRDVALIADYDHGELRLDKLSVGLWDADRGRPGGEVAGTAKIDLLSRGDLTAHLSLNDIDPAELARLAPDIAPVRGGQISGSVDARAPYDRIRDSSAWRANGKIAINDLAVADLPPCQIGAKFRIERGNLSISDLTVSLPGGESRVELRVGGVSPFAFQLTLRQLKGQLSDWNAIARQLGIDEPLSGSFTATGTVRGTLNPLVWSAEGNVSLQNLVYRQLHVDQAQFAFAGDRERMNLTRILVRLYQGIVEGSAAVSLDPTRGDSFNVRWQGLSVSTT